MASVGNPAFVEESKTGSLRKLPARSSSINSCSTRCFNSGSSRQAASRNARLASGGIFKASPNNFSTDCLCWPIFSHPIATGRTVHGVRISYGAQSGLGPGSGHSYGCRLYRWLKSSDRARVLSHLRARTALKMLRPSVKSKSFKILLHQLYQEYTRLRWLCAIIKLLRPLYYAPAAIFRCVLHGFRLQLKRAEIRGRMGL